MTYHLSTPESRKEVHGHAIPTATPSAILHRLRVLERAAQALVDDSNRLLTFPYDARYPNQPVQYCLHCELIAPQHTSSCPIAELERLLRGVV